MYVAGVAAKRGRPRGLTINPDAVEDQLDRLGMSKGTLCEGAGVSPGHLADMLHRAKGVSIELVNEMATVLRCRPGTIAPELSQRFYARRPGDEEQAA